ncbi:MAG: alpha/beta fold hydrolase [Variovorax sp.]|nr:MAG: alpha/beta fold hydrolase [Variovorax sp.]
MMPTRHNTIDIPVDGVHLEGTLIAPSNMVPGVLLVHGWDGSQQQDITRAHELAALGCICMTFDLRGHARHQAQREAVTREDNLRDVLAAYDVLVGHPAVDPSAVAVIGSSYGGYLAAVLTSLRRVRWLALRVPAIYRDENWEFPKRRLNGDDLTLYRHTAIEPEKNRALAACEDFFGDVLVVESEHDSIVPHPVIENYLAAFKHVRSLRYEVMVGADHAMSKRVWREQYTAIVVGWMTKMRLAAKADRDKALSGKGSVQRTSMPEEAERASGLRSAPSP